MFQVWSQIQRGNWCFGVRRWWGNSQIYVLKNSLIIPWQFPVQNIHLVSINQWSLRYKILRFFPFRGLSQGRMRAEGRRSSWDFKGIWGRFFRSRCFCHLRKTSFPLQKILVSTFFDSYWSSGGKVSQKALSSHVSTVVGVMEARRGDHVGTSLSGCSH